MITTKKVTISMQPEMHEKVDAYAKKIGINRSAAICVLISNALEQSEAVEFAGQLPTIMEEFQAMITKANKLPNNGKIKR
jgi:metal-responsive CopG/Arc/MetJ family transcriptional regulator